MDQISARAPPMIRVGNILQVNVALRTLALDPDALWRSVGLNPTVFEEPEARIPVSHLDRVLVAAERASGCDHIGLLVGTMPTDLGLPGFLALNAPTMREGLRDLAELHASTNESAELQVIETDATASLSYAAVSPSTQAASQIASGAIAQSYGLLKAMSAGRFHASQIRLPSSQPADLRPFLRAFPGERITFDAVDAAIEFPSTFLDHPVANANADLYRFLKSEIQRNWSAEHRSLSQSLRRTLASLVCGQELNRDIVAGLYGMHYKSLARRLAREDTDLQTLIDEARFEVARRLLRDTSLTVSAISEKLHYSEPSAFTRAFRRMAGENPSEWRESHAVPRRGGRTL